MANIAVSPWRLTQYRRVVTVLVLGATALLVADANAKSEFLTYIPNGPTNSCKTCHKSDKPSGNSHAWNPFGNDIKAKLSNGYPDWSAVCQLDSDGDGQTNGQELGDPCCTWTMGSPKPRTTDISNPGDPSSQSQSPTTPSCMSGSGVAAHGVQGDSSAGAQGVTAQGVTAPGVTAAGGASGSGLAGGATVTTAGQTGAVDMGNPLGAPVANTPVANAPSGNNLASADPTGSLNSQGNGGAGGGSSSDSAGQDLDVQPVEGTVFGCSVGSWGAPEPGIAVKPLMAAAMLASILLQRRKRRKKLIGLTPSKRVALRGLCFYDARSAVGYL